MRSLKLQGPEFSDWVCDNSSWYVKKKTQAKLNKHYPKFSLTKAAVRDNDSQLYFSMSIDVEAFYLRNRSALAVICWVINHCLEVSCKVDQITSADLLLCDLLHCDLLLNKSRTRADLFRF